MNKPQVYMGRMLALLLRTASLRVGECLRNVL